ncbi:MAG: ABC transporter permease [Clostridiales bacterium]|nr:ABC transporter permease [Clostridiales bacterium]
MRDFLTVFRYEFKTQMFKRAAIITMLVIMAIMVAVTSLPRIIALFDKGDADSPLDNGISQAGYVQAEGQAQALLDRILGERARPYPDRDALVQALEDREVEVGFLLGEDLSYEVLYQDRPMDDRRDSLFADALAQYRREQLLMEHGLSQQDYAAIENSGLTGHTTVLGQNSMNNYMISLLMMILVYFMVLMYGSSVSSIIAREKDSRTMEILITSTRPTQLIIGKVAAAGLAALVQFGAIVLVTVLGFQLNKSTYPPELLMMVSGSLTPAYILTYAFFSFFGFVLYLFLYAALGSTVSKMEDLASATGLVQFLFIAAYILSTLAAQMPGSALAVTSSILPFTSIMVMPLRSAMITIPLWELLLAGALMLLFVAFFAFLSIRIYRWGSLNYGNKTKLRRIVQEALRREHR